MVAQGAMTGVDDVFGFTYLVTNACRNRFVSSGLKFRIRRYFSVDFKGRGGHGAMPNACIDAAVIASSFVMNLQTIVSRETDPLDPVVVTIGRMDVGPVLM